MSEGRLYALPRPVSVFLFTNRNCLIFDELGNQIEELQAGIGCYNLDKEIAEHVIEKAETFYISKWEEWCHPIPRESFRYLLGLGSREHDLKRRER